MYTNKQIAKHTAAVVCSLSWEILQMLAKLLLPMTATLMAMAMSTAMAAELLLYLSYDMVVPRSPSHARVPCTNTYCAHIYRYTNELFF
uniref:Uncharacterized protein n=1 Tax=Glossina palpalis gambiensis TaxID=67801 RepID=A0A1B0BRZ5_9MUSC